MPHDPADFIGAWMLEDWRIEYADGRVTRPFGEGARGYIVYAADHVMSASICAVRRTPFGRPNARDAAASEKAAAFDSYFHYAGDWRIDGEDVVHEVTMALNPDMAGTLQRRRASFPGNGRMTLSAEETTGAGVRRHILAWRRHRA